MSHRSRERIREALPLADAYGLVSVVDRLSPKEAATWLITARNKFAESQDDGGVAHATRLLDRLRP